MSEIIRRALDSYRIRCWKSGLRCRCGCLVRVPWNTIKTYGLNLFLSQNICICTYPPIILDVILTGPICTIDVNEFKKIMLKNGLILAKYGNIMQKSLERWGDDYLSVFFQMSRYHRSNRKQINLYTTYLYYKYIVNFPKTVAVLETWDVIIDIPSNSIIEYVFANHHTMKNPEVRTLIRKPEYEPLIRCYTAKCKLAKRNNLLIDFCREGGIAKRISEAQWTLLGFWIRVKSKIRAWHSSYSFATSIPYTPQESLSLLIQRNPIFVPNAAYVIGTSIHRDADDFLYKTYSFYENSVHLIRWLTFLANNNTVSAHRALNKIWRTCSRSNSEWYFAFVNILLDATISHNRLLYSILHDALKRSFQFSENMSNVFWKCMQCPHIRPNVVAKLLYISGLRNSWHKEGRYSFSELLWTPGILANIGHECVCKELSYYLSDQMIISLATMSTRDLVQQSLWNSKTIQESYTYLMNMNMYKTRKDNFMERVPALWLAKQERRRQKEAYIQNSIPLRTFALRSSYKWRKLQKTDCPICMSDNVQMVPLHMDLRHAICKECRDSVRNTKNTCPLCRMSLSPTKSHKISEYDEDYEQEYEDEYYDDDQMYTYE